MSDTLDHELKSETVQVVPDLQLTPYPPPPNLWKQMLSILVFLVGIALLATAMTYTMAWLLSLG